MTKIEHSKDMGHLETWTKDMGSVVTCFCPVDDGQCLHINVWYYKSSLLMESKWSLDSSDDPFNWLESVTWTKLDIVESY